jgi:lipopolysaccharide biosynthesis glycosyltransferase
MTLIRCFLPEILSEEKVLWLDVDTLVLKPIDDLWNKDINGFAIIGWSEPVHQIKRKICFGYVNDGVLLMNLKFMRKIKATEKMVQLLNETFYPFAD